MFYGLISLPWWGYLVVLGIFTHITILAVTVYLHRCQAHRALDVHPALAMFFRIWAWLTTGMDTTAWAAIHRKHHAKCETAEDPHSPQILGLKKVFWEGAELYRLEAKNKETLERYGKGCPDDWMEHNVFRKHSCGGYTILFIINTLCFGVPGIAIWALQMMWIPIWAAGVVNGIGHYWGYRNFECPDEARNIFPWGILLGGEELHNNHHTYPTSAKLSCKWWEFDIGWLYIKIFSFLGLAKVKRVVPKPKLVHGKTAVDADALKALIANKIQVMTHYTKEVMLPSVHQSEPKVLEHNLDRTLWQRVKTALGRDTNLVTEQDKQNIEAVLKTVPNVEVVYQLREKLHDIWTRTTASQKELLELLAQWCTEAEATGNKALQDFSNYLKGYSISYN